MWQSAVILYGIKGNSSGNHKLKDEESTVGIVTANVAVRSNSVYRVIHPGITSSRTKNQPEKWLFRLELPAQGRGGYQRNGFPPEIKI
jgi:hypothetical protein